MIFKKKLYNCSLNVNPIILIKYKHTIWLLVLEPSLSGLAEDQFNTKLYNIVQNLNFKLFEQSNFV